MKIRKLETEEKQNTRKLYEEVFSEDSKDFVDYYYISDAGIGEHLSAI